MGIICLLKRGWPEEVVTGQHNYDGLHTFKFRQKTRTIGSVEFKSRSDINEISIMLHLRYFGKYFSFP